MWSPAVGGARCRHLPGAASGAGCESADTRVSPGGDEMLLQREMRRSERERSDEVIPVRSFTSGEGRGQGSRTGPGAAATLTHDTGVRRI